MSVVASSRRDDNYNSNSMSKEDLFSYMYRNSMNHSTTNDLSNVGCHRHKNDAGRKEFCITLALTCINRRHESVKSMKLLLL